MNNPTGESASAPAKEDNLPILVKPPDVPAGTVLPEVAKIGDSFDKTPSSVPQVSALAAESAVTYKAYQTDCGLKKSITAKSAGRKPLARTWAQSRRESF